MKHQPIQLLLKLSCKSTPIAAHSFQALKHKLIRTALTFYHSRIALLTAFLGAPNCRHQEPVKVGFIFNLQETIQLQFFFKVTVPPLIQVASELLPYGIWALTGLFQKYKNRICISINDGVPLLFDQVPGLFKNFMATQGNRTH